MVDSKYHRSTKKAKTSVCWENWHLIAIPINPKYQGNNERYRNKNTDTSQHRPHDAWPLFHMMPITSLNVLRGQWTLGERISRVWDRFVSNKWIAGCVFCVVGAGSVASVAGVSVGRWIDSDKGGWRRYERDVACYLEQCEYSVTAKESVAWEMVCLFTFATAGRAGKGSTMAAYFLSGALTDSVREPSDLG